MDLADDISYCVHDFEDGYELGAFSFDKLDELKEGVFNNSEFASYLSEVKKYENAKITALKNINKPDEFDLKKFVSLCVGFFISCVEVEKRQVSFSSPYLLYKANLKSGAREMLNIFEKIVWDSIILTPQSQQLVKNGQVIICDLFDVLVKNTKLLPKRTQNKLEDNINPERVVCDYVSGMTDRYAMKMHTKIFGSDTVSFFEK